MSSTGESVLYDNGAVSAPATPKKKSPAKKRASPTKKEDDDDDSTTGTPSKKPRDAVRPWTAAEQAVFWEDILRSWKPDWNFINERLSQVTEGPPRTDKSIRMQHDKQIKKQLRELAMVGHKKEE